MLNSVYFFAWTASVLYGVEAIVIKLAGRYSIANPWMFNYFLSLFTTLLLIPVALKNGVGIPEHWGWIVAASLFAALAKLLYILALYRLDVSALSPLFSFRTAFSVLAASVVLGETLTLSQYAAIAVIFILGFFVTLDERFNWRSFVNPNVGIALACTAVLAAVGICIKRAISVSGYWNSTLAILLLMQVWFLATLPFFYKQLRTVTKTQFGSVFGVAIISVAALLAANAAYEQNVSIAATIISLPISMVIAFVLALAVPKLLEKHTPLVYAVRFVSAAGMLFAALHL